MQEMNWADVAKPKAGRKRQVQHAGRYFYVLGIEDLILDRLNRAEFRGDTRSLEWARFLMASQQENVDLEYLRKRAENEHPKLLDLLEKTIEWIRKNKID